MKKLLSLVFVAGSFVSFSNVPVFSQSAIKTAYCSQKWVDAEKISLQQIKTAKDVTTKAQWQEYQKLMNSYKTGKQKPSSEEWRQTCGTPYPFTQTSSKPANSNCEILGKLAANSSDCLDYAQKKGIVARASGYSWKKIVTSNSGDEVSIDDNSFAINRSEGTVTANGQNVFRFPKNGVKMTTDTYIADCKYKKLYFTNEIFFDSNGEDIAMSSLIKNLRLDLQRYGGDPDLTVAVAQKYKSKLEELDNSRKEKQEISLFKGTIGKANYDYLCSKIKN